MISPADGTPTFAKGEDARREESGSAAGESGDKAPQSKWSEASPRWSLHINLENFIVPRFVHCSLLVLACLSLLVPVFAADDAPAWPQANGPFGNFNPRQSGVKLVDDLAQAKQLWVSEFHDLGFAKGSSSGFVNHLADANTHPGTASGLIVAEGKVFASSFRPRGNAWPEHMPHFKADKVRALFESAKKAEAIRRNSALDADDLTVAIPDAAHSDRTTMQWVTIDPQNIRRLGTRWKPPHHNTTAYEVFIELPYVDGLFLMRNWQGQVVCYDLRDQGQP